MTMMILCWENISLKDTNLVLSRNPRSFRSWLCQFQAGISRAFVTFLKKCCKSPTLGLEYLCKSPLWRFADPAKNKVLFDDENCSQRNGSPVTMVLVMQTNFAKKFKLADSIVLGTSCPYYMFYGDMTAFVRASAWCGKSGESAKELAREPAGEFSGDWFDR